MSSRSRPAASAMRQQLIQAGIDLLESDGPQALQARRVAAAAGGSTMAVYTHFGGMSELVAAIVGEAFSRFGAAIGAAEPTAHPITDFFVMGHAYRTYALANPQRYLLMFGLSALSDFPGKTAVAGSTDFIAGPVTTETGAETFEQLVSVVQRMIADGHIRGPVREVAARVWSLIHGAVLLELSGSFGTGDQAVARVLFPATIDLLVGMGADTRQVSTSADRAAQILAAAR
ncbi:MAG: WHG domain-containing protein [Nocardia sp.]|nr:WHG domain-containing protein [Nocardia sp.]